MARKSAPLSAIVSQPRGPWHLLRAQEPCERVGPSPSGRSLYAPTDHEHGYRVSRANHHPTVARGNAITPRTASGGAWPRLTARGLAKLPARGATRRHLAIVLVLLAADHGQTLAAQRLATALADVVALGLAILQLVKSAVKIADAAACARRLHGCRAVRLKDGVQLVDECAHLAADLGTHRQPLALAVLARRDRRHEDTRRQTQVLVFLVRLFGRKRFGRAGPQAWRIDGRAAPCLVGCPPCACGARTGCLRRVVTRPLGGARSGSRRRALPAVAPGDRRTGRRSLGDGWRGARLGRSLASWPGHLCTSRLGACLGPALGTRLRARFCADARPGRSLALAYLGANTRAAPFAPTNTRIRKVALHQPSAHGTTGPIRATALDLGTLPSPVRRACG